MKKNIFFILSIVMIISLSASAYAGIFSFFGGGTSEARNIPPDDEIRTNSNDDIRRTAREEYNNQIVDQSDDEIEHINKLESIDELNNLKMLKGSDVPLVILQEQYEEGSQDIEEVFEEEVKYASTMKLYGSFDLNDILFLKFRYIFGNPSIEFDINSANIGSLWEGGYSGEDVVLTHYIVFFDSFEDAQSFYQLIRQANEDLRNRVGFRPIQTSIYFENANCQLFNNDNPIKASCYTNGNEESVGIMHKIGKYY